MHHEENLKENLQQTIEQIAKLVRSFRANFIGAFLAVETFGSSRPKRI